jgi:hypothetical protein
MNTINFRVSSEQNLLLSDLMKKLDLSRSQTLRYALWCYLKMHKIISKIPKPLK